MLERNGKTALNEWTEFLSEKGVKNFRNPSGFYSFKYRANTTDMKETTVDHDYMPFLHVVGIRYNAIDTQKVELIQGVNLNRLPKKLQIGYYHALVAIMEGSFGNRRAFGAIAKHELDIIHPALKACIRNYNMAYVTEMVEIKKDQLLLAINLNPGKISITKNLLE